VLYRSWTSKRWKQSRSDGKAEPVSDKDKIHHPEGDWQVDWEGHRRRQLTAAMDATPAQRLAWLEEMLRIAYRSGALPRDRRS